MTVVIQYERETPMEIHIINIITQGVPKLHIQTLLS
jgi:hypothetical protein